MQKVTHHGRIKENWLYIFIILYFGGFVIWAVWHTANDTKPDVLEIVLFVLPPVLMRVIADKFKLFDI